MLRTRKSRKTSSRLKPPRKRHKPLAPSSFSALVLELFAASDSHAPTVAGVLGVTPQAVGARLAQRATRERWLRLRRDVAVSEYRAARLRWWWRARMRAIDVDPATLPVTDPAWTACHRFPRGHLVRVVALLMRRERPGESIATEERIEELLTRVADLHARGVVAVAEVSRSLGMLP